MGKDIQNEIMPPVLERYELKYQIPFSLVEPISRFVSTYCRLDYHSEIAQDNFYTINNVYFDTPEFLFLRNKFESHPNKINMRIRSYAGKSDFCFVEIKNKVVDIVKKYRGELKHDQLITVLRDNKIMKRKADKANENLQLFLHLKETYKAEPKILTQYKRKAYVSVCDDYARITFDTDLSYNERNEYNLDVGNAVMIPYDTNNYFEPSCNVILELKCYTINVPFWMLDLIREFDLVRSGFSKYASGIVELLNTNCFYEKDLLPVY